MVRVEVGRLVIAGDGKGRYDVRLKKVSREGNEREVVVAYSLTLEQACQRLIDLYPQSLEEDVTTLAELRDSVLEIRARLSSFLMFRS